jgi:hypothetical protein
MTLHTTVPSDIDPDSFTDLVDDCREVSGVLAPFVIDLNSIPAPRGATQLEISSLTAANLDGYSDYGS